MLKLPPRNADGLDQFRAEPLRRNGKPADGGGRRRTAADGRSYRQVGNYQRCLSPLQNWLVLIDRSLPTLGEAQPQEIILQAPRIL